MVSFGVGAHLKFSTRVPPTCIVCLASKKPVVYLHYMASCLGFGVIMCGVLWVFNEPTAAPDYLHIMQDVWQTDLVFEE